MTGTFEERERAYESKWAHDEELHFKVLARRNKLLGQWAAGEMGLSGPKAEEYASAVVQSGLGTGKDPVFHKLHTDFAAAKISQSEQAIHRKMEELFIAAGDQITKELKR
jgi:hypothetical protein